jgi:cell division protein FtsZ
VIDEIRDHLTGAHMVFVTAGMGGGTGTGAAPVIAARARDGHPHRRRRHQAVPLRGPAPHAHAEAGITELQKVVDTLLVIPNQNLFRVANEKTTFADAFAMADQVLYSGVACITDLMVKEGLINLDFADVRAVMREMGKAMMGTGEATGEKRAHAAGSRDRQSAARRFLDEGRARPADLDHRRQGPDPVTRSTRRRPASARKSTRTPTSSSARPSTNRLDGIIRVSVVATGIDQPAGAAARDFSAAEARIAEVAQRLRAQTAPRPEAQRLVEPAPQPVVLQAPQPVEQPVHQAPVYHEPAPQPQQHYEQPAPQPIARHDVQVQPAAPRQTYFAEPPAPAPRPIETYQAGPFVPPAAEQPSMRPRPMPDMADLPLPGQNQLRAQRGELARPEASPAENKRRTLLERLAAFGMSKAEEAPAPAQVRPAAPQLGHHAGSRAPNPVHSEYGKRPAAPAPRAPQALDHHGRPTPQPRAMEDDQLEIPAFLRRQSS